MAKIPLRAYVKEIENYIERGEIEQAVAHAKNILKSYPKHIDTYRLLGKAFLESQRYSEAADILQRVLSVIPDDFVSQIGMSIIREDEGNLDAAIWHMERAYEVQPFNPAVQDELRRLYGRRDGIEPPKIRLTRGALVRMYARGELYPQAIAETRAALSEDPQRLDLRVLLARLYYLSGHKNDAAEVCSELLSKLPYCYEANYLLSEILPTTSRAEEAKKFQQRIIALDPYAAFISPTVPTSDQVPDQAVMVEQFIWDSSLESAQQPPEWTRTIGVQWEAGEEEVLPDWLNTLKPESTAQPLAQAASSQEEPAAEVSAPSGAETAETEAAGAEATGPATTPEDLMPDWMKEAGWSFTDRKADEIMASQPEEPASDEITPAEIPDWLQSIAPSEASQPAPEEEERTEWLESLFTEQQSSSNGKEAGQVADLGFESADLGETGEETALPDWLSGLQGPSEEAPAAGEPKAAPSGEGELPDWFAQMQKESTQDESAGEAQAPAGPEMPTDLEGSSEWMSTAETGQPGETPDWLLSFEEPSAAPSEETPVESAEKPADLSAAGDLTGWLAAFASETTEQPNNDQGEPSPDAALPTEAPAAAFEAAPFEEAPAEAEAGELPDWLKTLQTGETAGAAAEELPAGEGLPEWLAGLETGEPEAQPEQPAAFMPTEPQETAQPIVEPPAAEKLVTEVPAAEQPASEPPAAETSMPDFSDMDATMAWLESLAAKQGADEATLITPPEQRTETPPDWVKEEIKRTGSLPPLPEAEAAAPVEPAEAEFTEEGQAEELRSWLAGLQLEGEPISAEPTAEKPAEIALETVEPAPAEQPTAEKAVQPAVEQPVADQPAAQAAVPDFSDMDAAMAWLESLAAKQGADEATLITPPEQRTETPPDWVMQEAETATLEKAEAKFETAQEPEAEQQPLTDEEQAAAEEALPTAELPDWLKLAEEQPPAATETKALETVEPTQPVKVSASSEVPPAVEQPSAEAPVPDFTDMDAAMAWLESLAAKQGADEATLVTPPEQRSETPPDWVLNQLETPTTETAPEAASPISGEAEQPAIEAELPDWLKEAVEARGETEIQPPEAAEPTIPQAAASVTSPEETLPAETPSEVIEQPQAEAELDMDSAFAWLESLAAKQGAQEGTLITTPEEREEIPPEWIQQEAKQAQPETQAVETEPPSFEASAEPKAAEYTEPERVLPQMETEAELPAAEVMEVSVEADQPPAVTEPQLPTGPETWAAEAERPQAGPQAEEPLPDWLKQVEMEEQPAATAEPEFSDWLKNLENEPEAQAAEAIIPPSPSDFRSAWEPEIEIAQSAVPEETSMLPKADLETLPDLQEALNHGNLESALEGYNRLINNGEHLEETIHDLRDALYRYPVDINLWQALGDAYARNNQLQEALDAYTKAEELLR